MKKVAFLLVLIVLSIGSVVEAKDPVLTKEDIQSINRNYIAMSKHLEFMGYKIEKNKSDGGRDYLIAYHPTNANIVIAAYADKYYYFRTTLYSVKSPSKEMFDFVNRANSMMNVCRFYCTPKSDGTGSAIIFEAVYTGEYDKSTFAMFMDFITKDHEIIRSMDNYTRTFLRE